MFGLITAVRNCHVSCRARTVVLMYLKGKGWWLSSPPPAPTPALIELRLYLKCVSTDPSYNGPWYGICPSWCFAWLPERAHERTLSIHASTGAGDMGAAHLTLGSILVFHCWKSYVKNIRQIPTEEQSTKYLTRAVKVIQLGEVWETVMTERSLSRHPDSR